MAGLPPPPGIPPLVLGAMRAPRFTMPIPVNRGREVAYEDLVPGKHYYLQRNTSGPMSELEFVEHLPSHSYRARYLPALRNVRNRAGNPLYAVYEPTPPHALGAAGAPRTYEDHAWPHYKFYEVSKIKRTGRFINPNITKKAKRQAVVNTLHRKGFPTAAGTGPTNTVLKFAGLQPPRKALGGKRRKTKKQRGGAAAERLHMNMRKVTRLLGKPPGIANVYYSYPEGRLDEGYGMIIGPRLSSGFDEEVRNAKYPFEECIIFLKFVYPEDYPSRPPKGYHLTPGILGKPNYRIHPNLYQAFREGDPDDRKVCLGILNTYGDPEWDPVTMGPVEIMNGIKGILEADPGRYEPIMFDPSVFISPRTRGVLYNKHSFAECLELTCAIYKAILQVIPQDATPSSILAFSSGFARGELPRELTPFIKPLALRAFSGLNFLINKIDRFVELNGGEYKMELGETMHKEPRRVDFRELRNCLEDILREIPPGLRVDIFETESPESRRAREAVPTNFAPPRSTAAAAGNSPGLILPSGY